MEISNHHARIARTLFAPVLLACALAIGLVLPPERAEARIPDFDKERLGEMANAIIAGEVLDVTFVEQHREGNYVKTTYLASVKVVTVEKGDMEEGDVITVAFMTSYWKPSEPSTRQPPGPQSPPSLYPCERVRVHLGVNKEGTRFFIVYPNGKESTKAPRTYDLPDAPDKPLVCK